MTFRKEIQRDNKELQIALLKANQANSEKITRIEQLNLKIDELMREKLNNTTYDDEGLREDLRKEKARADSIEE